MVDLVVIMVMDQEIQVLAVDQLVALPAPLVKVAQEMERITKKRKTVPVVVEPTLVVQPTQLQELAKELVAQVMVMVQVKELVKV